MTDLPPLIVNVPGRLGVSAEYDGELRLMLTPNPTTMVHGAVRTSAAVFVVDAVAGIVVDDDPDRWCFTTDLSIRMRSAPPPGNLSCTAEVRRRGRRSAVCTVDLLDDAGGLVGSGVASFATVPRKPGDPDKPDVDPAAAPGVFNSLGVLDEPLREAAGIEPVDAASGEVRMPVRPELCNAAGTLQGAMVALVAEAAVEDLVAARTGAPAYVSEMDVRYLGKATGGVVRASTRAIGDDPWGTLEVELSDEATGRITTHVYARAVPAGSARGGATTP